MNDQSNLTQSTPQGVIAGSIPLFAGHPSHDLLPVLDVQQAVKTAFDGADVWRMFDYGDEQGDPDLIQFLVERFNQQENLNIKTENLMIIAGSTAGVTMITHHLAQPHDTILVDAPSYRDALHIFRDYALDMRDIPIDDGGIIIAEMAKTLEKLKAENRLPKFYYVVPNFQNPTGITLSKQRREQVIELSQQYGFVIVEDDVYPDIRFIDSLPPSFYALAEGKNVLRLGTFSKTLSPGLRLGWLIGDSKQVQKFVTSGTLRMGGGANPFTAKIVAEYCKSGAWDRHVQWLRGRYQTRRDTAIYALEKNMPQDVTWTHPEGGYFIWVTLPDKLSVRELEKAANDSNVYFAPGIGFYVNPEDGMHNLRLSFSFVSLDEIKTGIEVLAQLIIAMI